MSSWLRLCLWNKKQNKNIKNHGAYDDLNDLKIDDESLSDFLTELISKIGENIQIISYKKYLSDSSIFISYYLWCIF